MRHMFTFARSVVYPFYPRYCQADDPRRFSRPLGVPNAKHMWNLRDVFEPPPIMKTYDEYILAGNQFLGDNDDDGDDPVEGVKGLWALDILPYADHIVKTKDMAHTFDHCVKVFVAYLRALVLFL
jgi:hypothetical protein